jgi:hypothetical protein
MASYIAGILTFMLVLSPLLVPVAVSVFHAIDRRRPNLAVSRRATLSRRPALRPAV